MSLVGEDKCNMALHKHETYQRTSVEKSTDTMYCSVRQANKLRMCEKHLGEHFPRYPSLQRKQICRRPACGANLSQALRTKQKHTHMFKRVRVLCAPRRDSSAALAGVPSEFSEMLSISKRLSRPPSGRPLRPARPLRLKRTGALQPAQQGGSTPPASIPWTGSGSLEARPTPPDGRLRKPGAISSQDGGSGSSALPRTSSP